MKSSNFLRLLSQVLLTATGTVAQNPPSSPTGIPEFSLDMVGLTLVPPNGTTLTSVTGQWVYPSIFATDEGLQWLTQFVAIDHLPSLFDIDPGSSFFPPVPIPASIICPNNLQVGTNNTLTIVDGDYDSGTAEAWAFYIWNNVTTNITDANGDLVTFVPGETVTVTLNVTEGGATFVYDSSVQGAIEVTLEGELCGETVQWAMGSPEQEFILGFDEQRFSNSFATEVDLVTGDISFPGPDAAVHTLLVATEFGEEQEASVEFQDGNGLTIFFESDCPDY